MSHESLKLDRLDGGVCVLTLNRPDARNAIDSRMQAALDAALRELEADAAVRAIVLTGAGDKAFSAGYDIKEFEALDEDGLLRDYLQRQDWVWNLASYSKPLIGAINGIAYGAGAIIATALDLRIGGTRTVFRYTAASYGGVNNTWHLPRVVGLAKAKEFLMTARRVEADEALQAGLLNRVVADDAVLDAAVELAAQIATHPPAGVYWHKTLLHEQFGTSCRQAFERENQVMSNQLRPGRPADVFGTFLDRTASRKEGA